MLDMLTLEDRLGIAIGYLNEECNNICSCSQEEASGCDCAINRARLTLLSISKKEE